MSDTYSNSLPPSKQWKIGSITIFTIAGEILYENKNEEMGIEISRDQILAFVKTIEAFSSDTLNEKLNEIGLINHRLVFYEGNQVVVLAVVRLGEDVKTGNNSPMDKIMRKTLQNISNKVENLENISSKVILKELGQNIENMISIINKSSSNPNSAFHNISDFQVMDEWDVVGLIIADVTGLPLVDRMYRSDTMKTDPILVSSFVTALKAFANNVFSEEISEIVMTNFRIYFKIEFDKLFSLIIKLQDNQSSLAHSSPVSQYIRELLETLSTIINSVTDLETGKIKVNESELGGMIDVFVNDKLKENIPNIYK